MIASVPLTNAVSSLRVNPTTTARVAGALAAALAAGCGLGAPRPNVLLVTLDTTRADRIGAYGRARAGTPALDALAAEGIRFERAYTAIPLTLPSHATILTGLYPPAHGVRDNGLFVLSPEVTTLAEILAARGWATGAAIGGFPLLARFGLAQGFARYDDRLRRKDEDYLGRQPRPPSLYFEERPASEVNAAILPWLEEHRGGPFFAWIHYYDAHRPWDPPDSYAALFADDPYQGEIAFADAMLGLVLERLRAWGVYERTLVVVVGDHGEGLGEHDEDTHSMLLYDSTLRVPLILKPPGGVRPQVVSDRVATADVLPTILDFLGLEPPAATDGESLRGYASGGVAPSNRALYAETLSPRLSQGWGELRALLHEEWKYVHGPRPELFDLEADPRELRSLAAERADVARRMRPELESLLGAMASAAAEPVPADAQTREQLRALGYLSDLADGGPIREELRDEGVAPQDRIGDINLSSEARSHLAAGRGLAAMQIAKELLARDPGSPFYRELLAHAHLALDDVDEATRLAEELAASGGRAGAGALLLALGTRLFRQGEGERAARLVARGAELEGSAAAWYQAGTVEGALGRTEEARGCFARALEADPAFAPARVDLAIQLATTGDRERASDEFERALRDDPFSAKGHYNYGAFLLETQRPEEAASHFRRAVALEGTYLAARAAVVAAELGLGRTEAARRALAELETMAPDSEETHRARGLLEATRR